MNIKTSTTSETKETKNSNITVLETTTTIYVEPVKVKTHYCFAKKDMTY